MGREIRPLMLTSEPLHTKKGQAAENKSAAKIFETKTQVILNVSIFLSS